VEDAASFGTYWLYEGSDAPKWDAPAGEWVFFDKSPSAHEGFNGLPRAVRTYLRELEPDASEREILGSLAGTEAGGEARARAEENPEVEGLDDVDENDVKIVEILQDAVPRKRKAKRADVDE